MLERFILEVADPPGRMSLYDYDSRTLLQELSGHELDAMLQLVYDVDEVGECADSGSTEITEAAAPALRPPSQDATDGSPLPPTIPGLDARSTSLSQDSTIVLVKTPEAAGLPSKSGRRKLWEIPHKYHCPIIGTCLEVADLRRIGAPFAWRGKARPNDYEIHVSFVSAAAERNSLALVTHKLLEKKYAGMAGRFAKARAPDQLLALWTDALASGEVPGAFWAIMTHPKADAAVMNRAYEDIHMLSHQIGAGQRADLKALAEARAEIARLKRDFDALQKRTRAQADAHDQELAQLRQRLRLQAAAQAQLLEREQELRRRLAMGDLDAQRQAIEARDARIAQLEATLSESETSSANWREKHALAQAECERLDRLAREREADCNALERLFVHSSGPHCDDCSNEECKRCADLGGRLVLCVGGRKPLVEQYRRLVNGCNGRFEHHDGGLEDNHRRLETMLAAADAVVCATDYVSHTAYYRTKRFCKRFEKPHVLLGNSGISSFARAIEQVSA